MTEEPNVVSTAARTQPRITEVERKAPSGLLVLGAALVLAVIVVLLIVGGSENERTGQIVLGSILALIDLLALAGLFVVNPNEAKILQLFGHYVGTVRAPGLRFANPFYKKTRVSVRVRNFETAKLKVNDLHSNPVEIAAVVVWKVVDTAEAVFEVDDFENYVHVQSEAALRSMATNYPYDAHHEDEISLSGNTAEVSDRLKAEIEERLAKAGVEVIEARISHLAYAPEIAGAMLQRQQASAVIAARQKIVEGAVGMVQMALEMLAQTDLVHLDEERKAAMVSNLLVVLCSERATTPVLDTNAVER